MAAVPGHDLADRIAAVRRFNRFYTARIGVLQAGYADSPFSLTEARVLYEIRERNGSTATDIGRDLDLDAGYLSRILRRFQKLGFIRRETSPSDARQSLLSLTPRGRKAFAPVEARSARHVGAMLGALTTAQQDNLVVALHTAETLLAGKSQELSKAASKRSLKPSPKPILREPRAGDFGWIVERHGILYGQEYGWGGNFEGVCAQIVADFVNTFDPRCERGWIAELDGRNVGCVLLVKDKPGVARLRLLLVEPSARGLGLGTRLTDECIRFACARGYHKMTLWTHSVLTAARTVYARAGFTLTSSEPKQSFGCDVVSEHWDLTL
jgi:DNA-binding MarR family transcriptional regulator/GNAT superfamily N-acetyltransferase